MQVINKIRSSISKTIKYILLFINILVLALLLASYSIWSTSPVHQVHLAYLGLGFIFILALTLLFTLIWLFSRKWWFLFLNLLVIFVCYPPIKAYFPLNLSLSNHSENSIKILSYNVRGFNREVNGNWEDNPLYSYLKESDADIICIQEYLASTKDDEATTAKLRKLLGYPYSEVTPLRRFGRYIYGLACFSRYPITHVETIPLKTSLNGSVMYKFEVKGKSFTVINNHLESNRLTSKDKALYTSLLKDPKRQLLEDVKQNLDLRLGKAFRLRAPQAEMVASYVAKDQGDAIIVCGDFNDTPMSYTYNQLNKNLVDSYTEVGFGPGITYHENNFLFRIDFILHSPNLKATKFIVDKVKYSDHYPISTYLSFKD